MSGWSGDKKISRMNSFIHKLTKWYFSKRTLPYWCILALDCAIVLFSGYIGTYIEQGGNAFVGHFWHLTLGLLCCVALFIVPFRLFHTYQGVVRYSTFTDLRKVTMASVVGGVLSYGLSVVLKTCGVVSPLMPSLLGICTMMMLATLLMGLERIVVKCLFDVFRAGGGTKKVFIYGVREGGVGLAKSILNQTPQVYKLAGFVSPQGDLKAKYLMGVQVRKVGPNLIRHMKEAGAKVLLVSPLQTEHFRAQEALVNGLIEAGIQIMIMPAAQEWDGKSDLRHEMLHEVVIEDLLPRDKIEVDMDAIGTLLHGKRILITGAAGSIGSEMVRQIAVYKPAEMVLIDQAETPMHDIRLLMARQFADIKAWTIVSSIANKEHMEKIFAEHRPDYVFHAAAYKHVPMMEDNPGMAVQNNIYGTRVIADLAVKYGTKKFVMISTDKAVNPTNVMGCSKRICEIYCQALNAAVQRELQAGGSNASLGSMAQSAGSNGSMAQGAGERGSMAQSAGERADYVGGSMAQGAGSNGSMAQSAGERADYVGGSKINEEENGDVRGFSNIPEGEGIVQAGVSDYTTRGIQVRQPVCTADESFSGLGDGQHSGGLRKTGEQGVHELPVHSQGLLRGTKEPGDKGSRCGAHNGRDLQSDVRGLQETIDSNIQRHQEFEGIGLQRNEVSVSVAEQQGERADGVGGSMAQGAGARADYVGGSMAQSAGSRGSSESLEPSCNAAFELSEAFEPSCNAAFEPSAVRLRQVDGSMPVTQFVTTRFGNVLGSNGSVIPIFKEQIAKGGPITVTHPDIIRFFMLIPEACKLVLEAGTMGKGGEIFVFDMGKPVRIVDLAKRMIALSGARDIEIEFTGLRDGEKLFEEVLSDKENTVPTIHPKIMVAKVREYPYELALKNEEELYRLSFSFDDMEIVRKMKEIVPEYKSRCSKYEVLDSAE